MKKQLEEALQEVCKLELLYIDTLVIQATTHRIYPLICINLTNILKMFFFNLSNCFQRPQQKKVIDELALSRQGFEEILLAKNKELEVSKV